MNYVSQSIPLKFILHYMGLGMYDIKPFILNGVDDLFTEVLAFLYVQLLVFLRVLPKWEIFWEKVHRIVKPFPSFTSVLYDYALDI